MAKKKTKRQPKRRVQKAVRSAPVAKKATPAKNSRDYGRFIGAGLLVLGLGLGGAFISQSDFSSFKRIAPVMPKAPSVSSAARAMPSLDSALISKKSSVKKVETKKVEPKKVEQKKAAGKKAVAYKPFKSKSIVRVAGQ